MATDLSSLFQLQNGQALRVDCLGAGLFRVRAGPGDCLHESGLNRYGIIRPEPDLTAGAVARSEDAGGWTLTAAGVSLAADKAEGRFILKGSDGGALLEGLVPAIQPGGGYTAAFRLKPGERLYGLGDVNRDCLQRRGRSYTMINKSVVSYAPIPFLMSPAGWAIFLNTTWFHRVDAGESDPDALRFDVEGGWPDFYLMAGDYPKGLLDRYTRVTGRPTLLPEWAYGLTFVCDDRGFRARDMLYTAYEFRRHGIPCNGIGLEPGWMEKHYDYSVEKTWSRERFDIPFWLKGQKHGTFAAALDKMGFKLSLWLCCDYDLSEHEEQLLALKAGGRPADARPPKTPEPAADETRVMGFQQAAPVTPDPQGGGAVIVDERLKGAVYQDMLTQPGQPWFEHLKQFVDDGARAFKLDGANLGLRHPDRKWANGMDDREMHNLHSAVYTKQMSRGYADYAKKRPMINIARGCAGVQQYAAMWAGDTGGGPRPLAALLNDGFCALSNLTVDMDVFSEAGIHFGFLQPWCQVCSWHQYNEPWFQGERLQAMFAAYARWRCRLTPYVYSMARVANETGLPIARAMPMAFPDDPESDGLLRQYLFGDAFLTAAFAETIYLPAGTWFDYWTGARADGPETQPAAFPADRGGPLFARAGALIPLGPDQAHWGQKPVETLTVEVFPGNRAEPFALFEDDGDTEAYRNGEWARTEFDQRVDGDTLVLSVSPRAGSYDGMPERRRYRFEIHGPRPGAVRVGGRPYSDWRYEADRSRVIVPLEAAPAEQSIELTGFGR